MEINRTGSVSGSNSVSTNSAVSTERATEAVAPSSQFTPTADLTNLLASVRDVPEVRQEVIGEVARRLASGEMFLPPSPDRVVGSLLESGALGDL